MELIDLVMRIILSGVGLLVVFFLGNWFTTVNSKQKDHDEELRKNEIKHIVTEKDNERQDKELLDAKKANQRSSEKFYKNADKLASSLQTLAKSQEGNHALIKENLVLIKQNIHRIEKLEDRQEFFINEVIKKK
jgi:5'-deoxynucleotidase YfbR-like HD superfamily hydrolase